MSMTTSEARSPVPLLLRRGRSSTALGTPEERSPSSLLFRRRSSKDVGNITSVSSSLLPAFGTVIENDNNPSSKSFIVLPYDRRYRLLLLQYSFTNTNYVYGMMRPYVTIVNKIWTKHKKTKHLEKDTIKLEIVYWLCDLIIYNLLIFIYIAYNFDIHFSFE